MPFREKMKKAFGRSPSSSDGSDLAKISSKGSRNDQANVYKPGEMPRPKYRGPYNQSHQDKLSAFSFGGAWTRRKSDQSQYSPMGSRLPSRRGSILSGRSPVARSRQQSSVGQVVENADGDDDIANIGLSPQHTAKEKARPLSGHDGLERVTNGDQVHGNMPDTPFTEDELTLALTKSTLRERRSLHTTSSKPAIPLPTTTAGPPPQPPLPAASQYGQRVERRRMQAELLKRAQDLRASQMKPGSAMKKRFWKDVSIRQAPEGFHILLDNRPVRTPSKSLLTIPPTKPHLASAIALEWDLLTSAQQALKQHLIPLTSLASRADDIQNQDAAGNEKPRQEIVKMAMRYLDTDTLLCWAPEQSSPDAANLDRGGHMTESLRDIQTRTAQPIIGYLAMHVWPGVEIKPVLDSDSIVLTPQPQSTKDVIRGWISGLPAYELAALERVVLASKSLLVAVRLLVEWSEEFQDIRPGMQKKFGIEEAAEASSLEVRWQTGMWGEVEDTHDVDNEDVRRQLGSAILLVSGQG